MDTEEWGLKDPINKPSGASQPLNIFKKILLNPEEKSDKKKEVDQPVA